MSIKKSSKAFILSLCFMVTFPAFADSEFDNNLFLANQNNAEAQYHIGQAYSNGKGVAKDEIKAFEWYKKSADNNFAPAQFSVANYYKLGVGVEKNNTIAMQYYEKSCKNGFQGGCYLHKLFKDMGLK